MKVKRRVVEERWRAIIEKLYEGDGPKRPTQLVDAAREEAEGRAI
jgi:hypothetical protein